MLPISRIQGYNMKHKIEMIYSTFLWGTGRSVGACDCLVCVNARPAHQACFNFYTGGVKTMAFTILSPSGSNLLNKSTPDSQIGLEYTLNTSSKWIYCNYPEHIQADSFGDTDYGNSCLNQTTVAAGTHQIFYSYDTNGQGPFYFGIQIFNPNTSAITYQTLYQGHADSYTAGGWLETIGGSVKNFFSSSSTSSVSISSNGVHWCLDKSLTSGIFTGSLRFSVTGSAIVTVYVYKTKSMIDGTAVPYYFDSSLGKQYSGYGNGYFYMASVELMASTLASGEQYFHTNYPSGMDGYLTINGESASSDQIPITMANPAETITPSDTANLGNWGTQYHFTLILSNDTASAKTFYAYVKTDTNNVDNWPIIQSGSSVKYCCLNSNDCNAWRWMSCSVPANSTVTDSFQWILGTNSCHKFTHIFGVE